MSDCDYLLKMDELGRVLLPAELRRIMGLKSKSVLALRYDAAQKTAVIGPHRPACGLCGGGDNLKELSGAHICQSCIEKLLAL